MEHLLANQRSDSSMLAMIDHNDLSCTLLSTSISRKDTGEHVATTTWQCTGHDEKETEKLFIHSNIELKSHLSAVLTFCPSARLAGERHLKRNLMPRVHPESCRPVDLLRIEGPNDAQNAEPAIGQIEENGTANELHLDATDTVASDPSQTPRNEDHIIPITNTFAKSRRGRKRKHADPKKSEAQRLSEALSDYIDNLQHLSSPSRNNAIRVVHFYSDKRCFAYASAHCLSNVASRVQCFPVISVVWQTNERPKRAIAISFSLQPSTESLRATCTCQPLRSVRMDDEFSCGHIEICMMDADFLRKVEGALKAQKISIVNQDRSTDLFGAPVPTDSDSLQTSFPAAYLTRENLYLRGRLTNAEKKRKKKRHGWAFWIVFDSQSFTFTPILKIDKKPFLCFACRLDSKSRGMCNHELTCFKFEKGVCDGREDVIGDADDNYDNDDQSLSTSDISSSENDNGSGHIGRTLYVTNTTRRSLLPCYSEVRMTERIAGVIEDLKPNTALYMHETNLAFCKKCNRQNTSKPNWAFRRNMNLFTLSHGTVEAIICDWYCQHCEEKNLFSGMYHGLFPARKGSCYTNELLYTWSQLVCYQGFSFREAYRTTRLTNGAVSNSSRFRKRGNQNFDPAKQPTRNRANEAFREFLRTMKTDCSSFTNLSFSCSRCEVPLTADDCAQLNIDQQMAADLGLKRFKAIVIDGTSAGVLTKLPKYTRNFSTLKGVRVTNSKIVPTAMHQNALKCLLHMCTESVRTLRKAKSRFFTFSNASKMEFWLHNPLETHQGITTAKTTMTLTQARIAMMMCDDNACFCGSSGDNHSEECDLLNVDFKRPKEVFTDVLSSIFIISHGTPPFQGAEQENQTASQQHNDGSEDTLDLTQDAQTQIRMNESRHNGDTNHQLGNSEDNDDHAASQNEPWNSEDLNNHAASQNESENSGTPQQSTRSSPAVSSSQNSIWATIRVPNLDKHAEFLEALMALLEFTTIERVSIPYITRISQSLTGFDTVPIYTNSSNASESLVSTASSSINLHRKVVQSLRLYCSCDKHGEQNSELPWEQCSCVDEVKKWACLLQDANPLLETFCIQLTKLRRTGFSSLHNQVTQIVPAVCKLLEVHIAMAISYFRKLDVKLPRPSKDYWNSCAFKDVVTRSSEVDDEFKWYETGMCFPGRSCCRPGIVFDTKETQHCNKHYPKSETHSPGLLTVQCACENPKLIGFIIMTRAESTALTLSAVLMYFPLPPRTVYYDNGCNLFASISLRLPWLLNCTRIAIDRFHYKSHTCSAFFCPDSYQVLDRERTETAESFNARIDKSLYHMRYLGSENLIPFLYNRIAQLNVSSLFKEKYNRQDLEDEDLSAFLRSVYKCTCGLCSAGTENVPETMTILNDGTVPQERNTDTYRTESAQNENERQESSVAGKHTETEVDNPARKNIDVNRSGVGEIQQSDSRNQAEQPPSLVEDEPLTPFSPRNEENVD